MGLHATGGTMKSRILLSAVAIAGSAAFAAAQQTAAPASPDRDELVKTEQRTTQMTTTETAPMSDMSASGAMVTGTVRTYEAGKSVTIVRPDGSTVTYTINPESQLPSDIAVGKKVTVTTTTVSSSSQPVVQRITYSTKTTTKTVEPPH
jgi:hypothetical protein